MTLFWKMSGEKLPLDMLIDMQKEWFNFEMICGRKSFSLGVLLVVACCFLFYKIIIATGGLHNIYFVFIKLCCSSLILSSQVNELGVPLPRQVQALVATWLNGVGIAAGVLLLIGFITAWWGILGIWLFGGLNHARCFDISFPPDQCCNFSDPTVTNKSCHFDLLAHYLPCGTTEVWRYLTLITTQY